MFAIEFGEYGSADGEKIREPEKARQIETATEYRILLESKRYDKVAFHPVVGWSKTFSGLFTYKENRV